MRWVMVEAAQVATRCSPAARRYYERLLRKKHKHVARVALARKLLIAVYALLHDGVVFEEEKFAAVEREFVSSMSSLLFESDAPIERRSAGQPFFAPGTKAQTGRGTHACDRAACDGG